MRKLAFDLGTKSCGFAITDENEIISSGLENFTMSENDFEAVFNKVRKFMNEYKIDGFVIGYPTKISGQKSERTIMVEEFSQKLYQRFKIPFLFVNEQYSTKKSQENLINIGLSSKKRKAIKDKMAAQLILQDYLDYHKNKWSKNE